MGLGMEHHLKGGYKVKEILVLLGTIILGVFITVTLVTGSGATSMKSKAESVGTKMNTDITKATSNAVNVTTP
jgi:hypothetical protein